jgi:hypothetical protein
MTCRNFEILGARWNLNSQTEHLYERFFWYSLNDRLFSPLTFNRTAAESLRRNMGNWLDKE